MAVILAELLSKSTGINTDVYCQELQRLKEKFAEIRPKYSLVQFVLDNAWPRVVRMAHKKLLELGWKILHHPPSSPDVELTDYHLAMPSKDLAFEDLDKLNQWLSDFFSKKTSQIL